jgi:flagellar protein FlbT
MYTSPDPQAQHDIYFSLLRDVLDAAPSVWPIIEMINNHILKDEMYKALKECRKLITYEQELIEHAQRGEGIRKGGERDRESA